MEIWKPVKGYEGFYEVSNFGKIKSVAVFSHTAGKVVMRKIPMVLKPETTHDGYKRVLLSLFGKKKKYSVHRIVAAAFIPNPNNYPVVNHKDEDTANNKADNLEWCTAKYNSNYGTLPKRISERCKNDPRISKEVVQFSIDGDIINTFPSINEASRQTGAPAEVISRCCKRKARTSGGFRWAYAKEYERLL